MGNIMYLMRYPYVFTTHRRLLLLDLSSFLSDFYRALNCGAVNRTRLDQELGPTPRRGRKEQGKAPLFGKAHGSELVS